MLELRRLWEQLHSLVAWAPGWLAACLILLAAAVAALIVHLASLAVLRRFLGPRHLFVQTLILRTRTANVGWA